MPPFSLYTFIIQGALCVRFKFILLSPKFRSHAPVFGSNENNLPLSFLAEFSKIRWRPLRFVSLSSAQYHNNTLLYTQILAAAKRRRIFALTPVNQHLDLQKGGMVIFFFWSLFPSSLFAPLPIPPIPFADKNELDYLLDKYQPEFEQIVPSLCDALNAVIVSHTLASRRRSVMVCELHNLPDNTTPHFL